VVGRMLTLDKQMKFQIEHSDDTENTTTDGDKRIGSIYVSSNKLITQFKTIIKETKIEYKDILNFTLAIVERKLFKILRNYHSITKTNITEKNLAKAILEILDFTFFIYAVSPRVNNTIKLSRIIRRLSEFMNNKANINLDFKHLIFKKVHDNIHFVLNKNRSLEHTQVETLYLLIVLSELGKEYWLESEVLCSYFDISKDNQGVHTFKRQLNYFSITVLLFYIKNKKRYKSIKDCVKAHIFEKYSNSTKERLRESAENVLLFFDLIVCPYIDDTFKRNLLDLFEVTDPGIQDSIMGFRKYWFTKWSQFDLGKELDAKQSQEVY
jgi:hypothetical protein